MSTLQGTPGKNTRTASDSSQQFASWDYWGGGTLAVGEVALVVGTWHDGAASPLSFLVDDVAFTHVATVKHSTEELYVTAGWLQNTTGSALSERAVGLSTGVDRGHISIIVARFSGMKTDGVPYVTYTSGESSSDDDIAASSINPGDDGSIMLVTASVDIETWSAGASAMSIAQQENYLALHYKNVTGALTPDAKGDSTSKKVALALAFLDTGSGSGGGIALTGGGQMLGI